MHYFWQIKANKLFPYLVVAGGKLLSAHAMPFAAKHNWSAWGVIYITLRSSLGLEAAEKSLRQQRSSLFCEGKYAGGVVQLGSK